MPHNETSRVFDTDCGNSDTVRVDVTRSDRAAPEMAVKLFSDIWRRCDETDLIARFLNGSVWL